MNLAACFQRIGFDDQVDVSHRTLRRLQQAFLLTVPFENFDIHLRRHIDFAPEAVYRKVVENGRGGFCYELNSLFHELLSEIGFSVSFLAARMVRDGLPGTVMGHMVLKVDVDGQSWLADVGNAKSGREPLNLDGSNEAWAEGVGFRVGSTKLGPALLETDGTGGWRPRYIFDPAPRERHEFVPVCEWTQSSPESRFTQHRICTLARVNGRATLMDNKLTIEEDGRVTAERVISPNELKACLRQEFQLDFGTEETFSEW